MGRGVGHGFPLFKFTDGGSEGVGAGGIGGAGCFGAIQFNAFFKMEGMFLAAETGLSQPQIPVSGSQMAFPLGQTRLRHPSGISQLFILQSGTNTGSLPATHINPQLQQ